MHNGKIPGAVFVAVQGDDVLCEKAYGVADLKTAQPVSTNQTLFRVASISKILTAASALELVHAGALNLHSNVNSYLQSFHIAPAFHRPITLANLLTHSSGFDDCQFGYASRSAADKLSLRDYLERFQPARVRPPGLFSVYDNYGFALAGYLVQKVSGMNFADYVGKEILHPLDMTHSTFSPDDVLRKQLAAGYWLDEQTPRACRESYINITPAAGFCTTANDMANFLVALLANKNSDGEKVFPASVLRGLETEQFTANPELPGRCYGFNRVIVAGRPALRQTGQWAGYNAVLLLFPKEHCGIFLAYNLCDYLQTEQKISRQFTEKFIPPNPTTASTAPPDSPAEDSFAPLLGSYLSLRAPHNTPELELPHEVDVNQSPDGNLEIGGHLYREIQPLVFEEIETNPSVGAPFGQRVAFRIGSDGNITHLLTQSTAYRHVNWMNSAPGQTMLLIAATIIFVSAIVLWPIMIFLRFAFANITTAPTRRPNARLSIAARAIAIAACLLALAFELSFAVAELRLRPFADFYGIPPSVKQLLWMLPVLAGFAVALAIFSFAIWRQRLWHPAHRLHYLLLTVALGVFLYTFYSRHLFFAS